MRFWDTDCERVVRAVGLELREHCLHRPSRGRNQHSVVREPLVIDHTPSKFEVLVPVRNQSPNETRARDLVHTHLNVNLRFWTREGQIARSDDGMIT